MECTQVWSGWTRSATLLLLQSKYEFASAKCLEHKMHETRKRETLQQIQAGGAGEVEGQNKYFHSIQSVFISEHEQRIIVEILINTKKVLFFYSFDSFDRLAFQSISDEDFSCFSIAQEKQQHLFRNVEADSALIFFQTK